MPEPRPGDDVEIWTGEPTRGTRISYAIVRGLILVVAKLFGRVHDHRGREGAGGRAPSCWPRCTAATSTSPSTALVTKRPMRYMGKDSIWKSKALGRFVSMLGAFPVHRGTADRDALQACTDIVNGGSPLVMFPEGTRCTGPVVEELFDGTAYRGRQDRGADHPGGHRRQRGDDAQGRQVPPAQQARPDRRRPDPAAGAHRAGARAAQRGERAHRSGSTASCRSSSTRPRASRGGRTARRAWRRRRGCGPGPRSARAGACRSRGRRPSGPSRRRTARPASTPRR